jgi:hypothetical protein
MVAVTKPLTTAVAGSPGCLAAYPLPSFAHHQRIGCRSGPGGPGCRWCFERAGETVTLDVDGTFVTNDA